MTKYILDENNDGIECPICGQRIDNSWMGWSMIPCDHTLFIIKEEEGRYDFDFISISLLKQLKLPVTIGEVGFQAHCDQLIVEANKKSPTIPKAIDDITDSFKIEDYIKIIWEDGDGGGYYVGFQGIEGSKLSH